MKITIGADPEVFIVDQNGVYQSPINVTYGCKEFPEPLSVGAIQADGLALEFNIPPANNEEEFVTFITMMVDELRKRVKEVNETWDIVFTPIINWNNGEVPEYAKELGCDVDYDLKGNVNPKPPLAESTVRTGGGHIHIGVEGWPESPQEAFTEALALANRVTPHLLKKSSWEGSESALRRQYYGNESFRPKSYGVEIRSLDNTWLASEETIRQVYRNTMEAIYAN